MVFRAITVDPLSLSTKRGPTIGLFDTKNKKLPSRRGVATPPRAMVVGVREIDLNVII